MPSGRTHDAITVLLAVPVAVAALLVSGTPSIAAVATAAFLFGGLMFGPDLDTTSRQYSRWGPLRLLWFPYRSFFKHRSRFSHGLVFGALFRVSYFMGVVSVAVFGAVYAATAFSGGNLTDIPDLAHSWLAIGEYTRRYAGEYSLAAFFAGTWLGAASHTFTDIAGSYIKTGRVSDFL
ncbi:MAG: metal-binding protein [Blastocatellia bacterium]